MGQSYIVYTAYMYRHYHTTGISIQYAMKLIAENTNNEILRTNVGIIAEISEDFDYEKLIGREL